MELEQQPENQAIENDEPEDAYASVAAALEEVSNTAPQENVTEAQKSARTRDETGKFAKKPDVPVDDKSPPPISAPDKPTEQPAVSATKSIPAAIDKAWTPAAKAKWNDLPPEIQAEITRREEEIHRGFTKFDEERVYGKQIKEAVTPYMPMIQAEGSTADKAINTLLSQAYLLRHGSAQEKFNLWINTAKKYNIPLPKEFGIPQSQTPNSTEFDPNAIAAKVPELVKKEFESYQQKQEEAQVKSTIDAFAADPAHPHYETVRPIMASLLANGKAKDMQDAYDQALWVIPEIRSTLQQSQTAQTEAQRVTDLKTKTAAAKKAGSSVAGAPGKTNGAARPANSNPDPYESVSAAFDQVHAR